MAVPNVHYDRKLIRSSHVQAAVNYWTVHTYTRYMHGYRDIGGGTRKLVFMTAGKCLCKAAGSRGL